jgi:putative component of toxin-antitoxin plasmid stabilization module
MCYLPVIELREYINAQGVSPFAKWRERLHATTRARITVCLLRLESQNFSAAKGVGSGLHELRLDFGPVIASTSVKTVKNS